MLSVMDDHVDCHQKLIESLSHFNILQPISSSTVPCAQLLRMPCKTRLLTQRKTCSHQVNYQKVVQIWIIPGSVHQFCCWFSWRRIFCNEVGKVALVTNTSLSLICLISQLPVKQVTDPKSRGKIILETFVRGNWEVHDTANISKKNTLW
jgi:hypothetical protein